MTRPDKRAARFGARYRYRGTPLANLPVGTFRRLGNALRAMMSGSDGVTSFTIGE